MDTLESCYQKGLLNNLNKPFTLIFNGCKIPVSVDSTYESVGRYYYNNVNLNQFGGWS